MPKIAVVEIAIAVGEADYRAGVAQLHGDAGIARSGHQAALGGGRLEALAGRDDAEAGIRVMHELSIDLLTRVSGQTRDANSIGDTVACSYCLLCLA